MRVQGYPARNIRDESMNNKLKQSEKQYKAIQLGTSEMNESMNNKLKQSEKQFNNFYIVGTSYEA